MVKNITQYFVSESIYLDNYLYHIKEPKDPQEANRIAQLGHEWKSWKTGLSFEVCYECQKLLLRAVEEGDLSFGIVGIRKQIWVWKVFRAGCKNLEPGKQLILNKENSSIYDENFS